MQSSLRVLFKTYVMPELLRWLARLAAGTNATVIPDFAKAKQNRSPPSNDRAPSASLRF